MAKTRSGYKRIKSLFGKYKIIPEEWDLKKLEEVGKIIGGGTPDSKNKEYWNGKILWAIPTDITKLQTNQIENTERKITKEGLDSSSAKLLPKGTILITSRATIGECAIATKPISTNQGFQSIICDDKNFNRTYIFYSIKCHKNELLRLAYGTTFLEINKTEIKKVMLPAPSSILEQQKIASILSGVDALIESTQHIIEKTERLKKGLMQQLLTKGISQKKLKMIKSLFGRYEEIPKEWTVKKINDFATVRGRIGWKNLRADEYMESGPLMLSVWSLIGNILYGIDYNVGIKRLSKFRYDESPEIQLKDEDVLVAKDGDIGRIGFVKKLPEHSTVNSHVVIVRIKNKQMHPEYLYHYMKFHPFQTYCKSYTSGTTVPLFTQKDLRNALIISPQIDEQQKIASILSGVDAVRHHNIIALIILRIKFAIFLILCVWIGIVHTLVF